LGRRNRQVAEQLFSPANIDLLDELLRSSAARHAPRAPRQRAKQLAQANA
jgi:hypothetical protein